MDNSPQLCLETFRPLHQRSPSPLPPFPNLPEIDTHRRDSGVLVDDLEPVSSEPYMPAPMPLPMSHDQILANIREGQRSPYENMDFEATFPKASAS